MGAGVESGVDSKIYLRGANCIVEVSSYRLGPKRVQGSAKYGAPRESFPEVLGNLGFEMHLMTT